MQRRRYNPRAEFAGYIQDGAGHLIGNYKTLGRDLLRAEVEIVKEFLIELKRGESMGSRDRETEAIKDACNIVHLAGRIEKVEVEDDGGYALVNPGGDTRYIFCTVYKEKELSKKLDEFSKGDLIKIVGQIRVWSKKDDEGNWNSKSEVRITRIANEAPERRRETSKKENSRHDDDTPF